MQGIESIVCAFYSNLEFWDITCQRVYNHIFATDGLLLTEARQFFTGAPLPAPFAPTHYYSATEPYIQTIPATNNTPDNTETVTVNLTEVATATLFISNSNPASDILADY